MSRGRSHFQQDDEDAGYIGGGGTYRIPDKDVYRRTITTFGTICNYLHNRHDYRVERDRRLLQPHLTSLKGLFAPFANKSYPADGICTKFLRKGLIKPNKTQMTVAGWSPDARWLVLGTVSGDIALWEGDSLKVHKVVSLPAHKVFNGEDVIDNVAITAMAWNTQSNVLVTGDNNGLIQYCDETFREAKKIPHAHNGPIRGLSFSPFGTKLVSCSDDAQLHIWTVGKDSPEVTLTGHQSDIKCCEWHPYRGLVASGSRDASIRLWDPRNGQNLCALSHHKKQVSCLAWNKNGNWLATGSKDNMVKLFDIRVMKVFETYRGHNSDVCSMAWHPHHETLLLSGGYNGSLIYWLANYNQAPHSIIADAHRQSIDIIAWHPMGHMVATASHDGVLKFWCRELPGATLEYETKEFGDNPTIAYGPLHIGDPLIVPATMGPSANALQQQQQQQQQQTSSNVISSAAMSTALNYGTASAGGEGGVGGSYYGGRGDGGGRGSGSYRGGGSRPPGGRTGSRFSGNQQGGLDSKYGPGGGDYPRKRPREN